jgi:hypothetical protein
VTRSSLPLLALAAWLYAACASSPSPVTRHGDERWLDLGELAFALDPTTDERFIRVAERSGTREISFHEKDSEGGWARIEIHRRPLEAGVAASLTDGQHLQNRHDLPSGPIRPAATPLGNPAWIAEAGLPESTHHEPLPDGKKGHSTVQDPPRYRWMAALVTPSAVHVIIYVAGLVRAEDRELSPEEILRDGKSRHGARADAVLARLRPAYSDR